MPEVCEVCEVLNLPQPTLFATEFWTCNLAPDQAYLGRSYLTLKRHCGDIIDLSGEEWTDLQVAMRTFETGVRKAFKADLFNWSCLMNNAYKSRNPRPHIHWHARPRYNQPVSVAGQKFANEKFGHHYERHTNHLVSDDIMRVIQQQFTKAL